jgi:cytochrome P450
MVAVGYPVGPKQLPLVNMVRWLHSPLQMLDALSARYGTVFSLRLPRRRKPMVFFAEPTAVRDLWTGDPEVLHAGEAAEILRPVLGENSLLLLDGERHLRERRLLLPPFHGDRMRAYGEVMRDVTQEAVADWPLGRAFPVHASMQAITLEVIMRAIFGVEQEDRLASRSDALVRWATVGTTRLGNALLLLTPPEHAARIRDLATRGLGRFLPWAPITRAQLHTNARIRELIVTRRREGTVGRQDVLSMLIEARDEQGRPMTDDELHDEMLTLLIAGHETTATTLAWTLHYLVQHPAHLARVVAEVRDVVADGPVRPDHGDRLVWLDAAIKETLRLMPIIPLVGRVLARPMRIGGIELPAGVAAVAAIYLVHRRADLWPEPTRWNPERFVGKKPDPTHYFPFGGGARRCLGMAFASYEMKIVLATILAQLDLAAATGERIRLVRRGITIAPSGGMPIVVTRRIARAPAQPGPTRRS